MRNCEGCGKPLENPKPKTRYCSDACRKRVDRKAEPKTQPQTGLVKAVRKLLTDTGVMETSHGQLTLQLAERMENSQYDTAAAVAALSKELRSALDAVAAMGVASADPMDELQARRLKRNAG